MSDFASRSRPGAAARLLALLVLLAQLAAGVLPHTHALLQSGDRIGSEAAAATGPHASICPACVVAHSPAATGGEASQLPFVHESLQAPPAATAEPQPVTPSTTRSRAPPLSA